MDYIEYTFTFEEPSPWAEILMTYLCELPFESFNQEGNDLLSYIPSEKDNQEAVKQILADLPYQEVSFQRELIKDQNWNAKWEEQFDPIFVGDSCVIYAPFHNLERSFNYEIIIQPQMSFGTGHHQTTYLMIQQLLSMDLKNKEVLDMGSGTGVLAILAEKLGASTCLAIDIDEWAYQNAKENVTLNKCEKIEVLKGDADLLHENQKFDVIIANINRNILLNDMKTYASCLDSRGKLLLSGFYTTDIDVLDEEAIKYDLKRSQALDKEGWAMIEYTKF